MLKPRSKRFFSPIQPDRWLRRLISVRFEKTVSTEALIPTEGERVTALNPNFPSSFDLHHPATRRGLATLFCHPTS